MDRQPGHLSEQAATPFWEERLRDWGGPLSWPVARTAAALQDSLIGEFVRPLPLGLALRLDTASSITSDASFAELLTALALLVARLSGQSDIVIGTPREHGSCSGALALDDMVPLRLHVSLGDAVTNLRAEAIRAVAEAAPHRHMALPAIATAAGRRCDELLQVLLSAPAFPAWPLSSHRASKTGSGFAAHESAAVQTATQPPDLHLCIDGACGTLRMHYATALFDPASAERLAQQFVTVWGQLVADPQQRADQIALLTPAERQQVLEDFNATRTAPEPVGLIHQAFEACAARQPDADALFAGGEVIRYGTLNVRANQLAHRLLALGLQPNDRVAIAVERSVEMLVGVLGVLKAGGAYVPLDPGYPPERLAYMVADCRPTAVLTQSALQASLPPFTAPVIALDIDALLATQPTHNPDASALGLHAGHTAYVIYTSGSTGQPKGASVLHRGLVNLLHWYEHDHAFTAHDKVLVVSSFSFDLTQKNLFVCLQAGGQLHLASPLFDPAAIVQTIERESITTLNLTPSAFYALVDAHTPGCFASLRRVFLGGETINVTRLADLGRSYPQLALINSYGPTECSDVCAAYTLPREGATWRNDTPPIGRPIDHTQLYVLDAQLQPLPIGVTGEIYIGGAGVGAGYLHRPDLTAERFVPDPFHPGPQARLYKTGDQGRWRPDGLLDYVGRNDFQVKIRGFRIELGEIEAHLAALPGVSEAIVMARQDAAGEPRLVAYLTARPGASLETATLRTALSARVADYMVPNAFVMLSALPLTPSGKVDRNALPHPERHRPELATPFQAPTGDLERSLCDIFAEVLAIDRAGRDDNFFELGGTSLQALRVLAVLVERGGPSLSAPTFFTHSTPATLARAPQAPFPAPATTTGAVRRLSTNEPIAIIGMAGRFPGANDVEALWQNLLAGKDGITRFTLEALDPSVPATDRDDPSYVRARGVLDQVESFDHRFFGMSAREAEVMDPQHRLFLELAWECIEHAGYAPDGTTVPVGVFGGIYGPSYLQHHVMAHPEAMERAGDLQVLLSNDKDYAALRVAHKLNLKGPAVAIHTSCSTSLVAIAQAVDSLHLGRCQMALAGGVTISSPSRTGYFHNDGSMLSSDGHTRTFDARADGTVFNDGAAFVLLKPLAAAQAEGDHVFALIRSVATNNDGGGKASFTAPSVEGQANVIALAHQEAGIGPRSISYVEAHGTATPLGDPVEVEALTRAFRLGTADTGFCRIGSLKSNIGHLVTAAGAASVIKTALALDREQLPASIHFETPNPKIDFAHSPFVVNATPSAWPRGDQPRRAGVSNFGVGGTNAHAVLEEAPQATPSTPAEGPQLLLLSARTPTALDAMATALADHLEVHPDLNLADVAHTLQYGRSRFAQRLCVVGDNVAEISLALRNSSSPARAQRVLGPAVPPMVWLFSGQGSQYAGMGRSLYAADDAFRHAFDAALAALSEALPFDLKTRVFEGDAADLAATATTQPALFCVEYALAQSWLAQGARPVALIGHSVGEFTAAVLAGVMSLADAAALVARRGALMQALPGGAMLSVRLPAASLADRLPVGLSVAAENSPNSCVVAGPHSVMDAWQATLESQGIVARPLQTSHAFHSAMMDAAVAPFEAEVRQAHLVEPTIPIVSTATGDWLRPEQAKDPEYWSRHLRAPVRFSSALRTVLARHEGAAFLEVGPRGTLATLARQHAAPGLPAPLALPSLGDSPANELHQHLLTQGVLSMVGVPLTAAHATPGSGRRRVVLPTYPFERQRCWLEAAPAVLTPAIPAVLATHSVPAAASTTVSIFSPFSGNPVAMNAPLSTAHAPRHAQLVTRLRALFEDIAGLELGTVDTSTPFVEMGLDSLTLTQAAMQVKRQFGVPLSFRQLMENERHFEALAAFLDHALPPEATTEPVPAPAPSLPPEVTSGATQFASGAAVSLTPLPPLSMPAPAAGTLVQQVLQQQMQLMAQQLALLGGLGNGAATAQALDPAQPSPMTLPLRTAPMVDQASRVTATTSLARAQSALPDETGPTRYDVQKAFGAIARIHTQSKAPTERQKARLAAFIRRYVERTRASKAFTEKNRPHMADPRVVNGFRPATKEITYQIVVERSKGSQLWDIDGNQYVDVLNGFGMNLFGWQPDFILDAVRAQLDAGFEIGPQHPLAADVTQSVCDLTGFDRAGLCNTGSEAVMAAIRIARTVTGRSTVVVFTGSYHGTFDEVLVRAGRGARGMSAAPGVMQGMFGDVRVLDYGTPEALEFIRANADDLAAVLVEPVQSRRPDFQPREFLREVRAITAQSDTCLIFDEVITGFRSHLGGAQAIFGVRADLACYGKVIGGGMPVGVVAGKRAYMDALDGGAWQYGDDSIPSVGVTYFAGTFVRHPLALAACKASLDHLKQAGEALQTQLNLHTAAMANELSAFCREVGAPIEIHYFSSLWRVSWLEDHPLQDLLFAMMRSRGVHILDNFPCFMTTAHSHQDIAAIKSAFKESVAEMQEAEFLPRNVVPSQRMEAAQPPVPNARLGRDKDGQPAWFIPDPAAPGKFVRVQV